MALACGIAVANIYYNQPLLVEMRRTFHVSIGEISLVPTLTQIGGALGVGLFGPLGDVLEHRRVIVMLLVATSGALVAAAVSPSLLLLATAHLAIGVTEAVPELIISLAAQLTGPAQRGQVIGSVTSGLLIGLLIAPPVSGFVGAELGWRVMYWLASGLIIVLAVVLIKFLPKSQPSSTISYQQLLRSLPKLVRRQPLLREASIIGAMLFGAFSAFWTTLAFLLAEPPYHYGSEVVGLFGLVAGIGVVTTPLVGRLTDRTSPRLTIGLALSVMMFAVLVIWLFKHQLWGLIVGVILLEFGLDAAHVSNQAQIYSLPMLEAHSRLISVYMVSLFSGGALGSLLGAYGWSVWRLSGVCLVGLLMLIVAFTTYLRGGQC